MRWLRVLGWTVIVLVLIGAVADAYLANLAHDNLSNEGFNRVHERTPADVGLPFAHVLIPSGSLSLKGWWIPAAPGSDNASTTVVLVHGVGSTMGKMVRMWAPNLHAAGYSVLAFDLRNHGASPDAAGGLVTYGMDEADDVAGAVAFVQDSAAELGVDPDRIVLYGGSMGGAAVINAAARPVPGVAAVIADSAYASFGFQARVDGRDKGYPVWLVDLVVRYMDAAAPSPPSHSDPERALYAFDGLPVLLLSCTDDARVTHANAEHLAQAATSRGPHPRPDTWVWEKPCPTGLSKDHHLDGFMQADYNATVLRFIDEEVNHPLCCRD